MPKNTMIRGVAAAIALSSISLFASTPAQAEQWYFWVQNSSEVNIQKLLVSENKRQWFEVGDGLNSGEKNKLVWDESTNSEGCTQWIKAQFSNGEESPPSKINFCENLDDPIVFE
ncbi:hypothetical protein JOY44_30225 (plasmid) [Phormidium sp. CLA17]|nr:hypothetical protein [Leptolyngbya sp. Cla-17]